MSRFVEHIRQLRDDLDDLIYYLERKGEEFVEIDSIKQIREELDDRDPFIKVNASIEAQYVLKESVELH